jgi:hypothetical protein
MCGGDWQLHPIPPHYQAPDHGHQYAPYAQFEVLVHEVGNVRDTLQQVVTNVDVLSQNFSKFMTKFNPNFQYAPPSHSLDTTNRPKVRTKV